MRYQEVIRRYLAIREASSREWTISPTLVMTVEIDMSADTYVTMAVATSSSQRRRGPQFMRVMLFRAHQNTSGVGADTVFHGMDVYESKGWTEILAVSDDERFAIDGYLSAVRKWSAGGIEDLPESTSRVLADSLSRAR